MSVFSKLVGGVAVGVMLVGAYGVVKTIVAIEAPHGFEGNYSVEVNSGWAESARRACEDRGRDVASCVEERKNEIEAMSVRITNKAMLINGRKHKFVDIKVRDQGGHAYLVMLPRDLADEQVFHIVDEGTLLPDERNTILRDNVILKQKGDPK